jgi:hypothetical protein
LQEKIAINQFPLTLLLKIDFWRKNAIDHFSLSSLF